MFATFVVTGTGILCLAWALCRVGGRWSRAVPTLLAAAGAGMIVSGMFRTNRRRSGTLLMLSTVRRRHWQPPLSSSSRR